MQLATAQEDVTLAEERAKEAETKEHESSAQVMVLRRQVHQLKEHNERGLARASSIASATNSTDSKSRAQEAEDAKPSKGVKREREEDGEKEAEASKRANQQTQSELEEQKSLADSRLTEVNKLRGIQSELTQKCRALEDRAKEVTDEDAVKSSAYTLLNFKFHEALRDQETVGQTLDSQQWRIDKEEAMHRLELEKAPTPNPNPKPNPKPNPNGKARTNSLQQHTTAMADLKEAQSKVVALTAERDALQRKLEAAQGQGAQGVVAKETKEMCDALQAENTRHQAENMRLKKQIQAAMGSYRARSALRSVTRSFPRDTS